MSQKSVYLFENGLRKVRPYFFEFKTPVKHRWVGRTLVEVLTEELGQSMKSVEDGITNRSIYVHANAGKKTGSTVVEGWNHLKDRLFLPQDVLYNSQHIHEPSVPDVKGLDSFKHKFPSQARTKLQIIFENEDLLVVNKPSGVPTTPSGSFRYNSVSEILKYDLGLPKIWACHRLDKVTSGVLIVALNSKKASHIMGMIRRKEQVSKSYVARVVGDFPSGEYMLNCPVFLINPANGYINETNADNLPTNSTTIFRKISYDPDSNHSIVYCRPLTGRMHQIRIHLRNLGHPIANDDIYNPNLETSPVDFLRNETELKLYDRIFEVHPGFKNLQPVDESHIAQDEFIDVYKLTNLMEDKELSQALEHLAHMKKASAVQQQDSYNKTCDTCNIRLFDNNLTPKNLMVWLHAYKYELNDNTEPLKFETPFPTWCEI